MINQHSDSSNPNYCHRVTADDGLRGEQHLRDFQDNEKIIPTVLTTSQKLSTGVDAPEIRSIVFLRQVKSRVEFKQIVGRGTHLFDGKDHFTIYDFVKAHEHFNDPDWDGEPMEPEQAKSRKEKDTCDKCSRKPCICYDVGEPEPNCKDCSNDPCMCEAPPKYMQKIKLSDHKVRSFDSMVKTSLLDPEGRPLAWKNL